MKEHRNEIFKLFFQLNLILLKDIAQLDSALSETLRSLTQCCPRHCSAWLSAVRNSAQLKKKVFWKARASGRKCCIFYGSRFFNSWYSTVEGPLNGSCRLRKIVVVENLPFSQGQMKIFLRICRCKSFFDYLQVIWNFFLKLMML